MGFATVHHDPDDERRSDEDHRQHRETGDGCQLPHVRRLLHGFTWWSGNKAAVQAQSRALRTAAGGWECEGLTCVAGGRLGVHLAR